MKQENFDKAYGYAVYLLGLKLRTEGELREKMRLKKYAPGVINEVIAELLANKYVDDQRYAEIYLDNLKKYKTLGFYGIKKKLMEKRLSPEIIESVLAEDLSVDEEMKIARRFLDKESVIARRLPATRQSNAPKQSNKKIASLPLAMTQKQKFAQKIKAKGFRGEVIAKLVF